MKFNANWIRSARANDSAVYSFEKRFSAAKKIEKAELTVSAMGIYKPYLNGEPVGNAMLAPGWTSYNSRVLYQRYDITANVKADNIIAVRVANGWAAGYLTYKNKNHLYTDHTSLTASVRIVYYDGTEEETVTDESWEVYTTEVTFAELYHGETVDMTAKREPVGKAVSDTVSSELVFQDGSSVTEHERLAPAKLIITPKGERVLDFGQNMSGFVEIRVKGNRGDRIVLHHGEVLDADGNFYNANYRTARNEMTYILSGENDVFRPNYSFQGFRYVRLTEYPLCEVALEAFRAVAIYTDMKRTGRFICGNRKINQLYHNILWGQKSNFVDLPTDCPQRDERLGWLADAQVFCRTAAVNYDVESFFEKWLCDVAIEQYPDGSLAGVVPDCQPTRELVSAAWGDAACIIPWQLYLSYGNKELLARNFPMMKKWVEYIRHSGSEEYLWLGGLHFGDWMALDGKLNSYFGGTSNDLIATVFYAHSTRLLIKAGEVLGYDMTEYKCLYANIRQAFRAYFMENGMPKEILPLTEVTYDGRVSTDRHRKGITQTSLTLILHFGMCESHERGAIAEKLVSLIRYNGMKLCTGFVGTPYILHALSENGYADIAYRLLLQESAPSWLFAIDRGATTVWEHWDSIREDGTFWSDGSNSFNHYAYGSVFDWIFGVAVGITTDECRPAYKAVHIEPHPSKKLGFADASVDTSYGTVRVYWYYKGDDVYYEIDIPDGVTAEIKLPNGHTEAVGAGNFCFVSEDKRS